MYIKQGEFEAKYSTTVLPHSRIGKIGDRNLQLSTNTKYSYPIPSCM